MKILPKFKCKQNNDKTNAAFGLSLGQIFQTKSFFYAYGDEKYNTTHTQNNVNVLLQFWVIPFAAE